jgi:hypothetical protein
MFTIPVEKEEVLSDYPNVEKDWIELSNTKFLNNELDEEKMSFFYSYGFFLPKINDMEKKIEFYENMYENTQKMMFDERLEFELKKVRVNLTMLVGKNFVLSNRMPKGTIPDIIRKVVTEVTKVKMLVEYEFNNNEDVKKSIPEIDTSIISFEIIRDVVKDENKLNLDIDDILDKISQDGLDSLSDEEREFLDKKSKDV